MEQILLGLKILVLVVFALAIVGAVNVATFFWRLL